MLSIASAVEQIVSESDFAVEGMQTGCLNLNAYADQIITQIESLTKKSVQKGSIVVALARVAHKYQNESSSIIDYQLHNLVSLMDRAAAL